MSLHINTNLQSLLVQSNLTQSTNAVNAAIERMTTGYKINHSKDNAANYSISNEMSSKLSSYNIAQDNVAAGLDLLSTAQDTISLMQTHGQRIHALITQAQNGTYGSESISTIQAEVDARMAEIRRLYANAEYNGISLFGPSGSTGEVTFINDAVDYSEDDIAGMDSVSEILATTNRFTSGGVYSIGTIEELQALSGRSDTKGATFVLASDIDLSSIDNWTPIRSFCGTFNGNGHVIKNMKITSDDSIVGLFEYIDERTSVVKNLGMENVNIDVTISLAGGIVGLCDAQVDNCYVTGVIKSTDSSAGGIAGSVETISNCASSAKVTGANDVGGLVGAALTVSNSYATGSVTGISVVGGLVGNALGTVSNSYATGSVTGTSYEVGGLVGYLASTSGQITNSYATGSVTGTRSVGGLVGDARGTVSNSYATGSVTGTSYDVGGLVGIAQGTVSNSYATGSVTGTSVVGGLVGGALGTVSNSYATGDVTASSAIPESGSGIAGYGVNINNSEMSGKVMKGGVDVTSSMNYQVDTISESLKEIAGLSTPIPSGGGGSSGQGEGIVPITLQVGIMEDFSSQIVFETSPAVSLDNIDVTSSDCFEKINAFLNGLSAKATEFGAIANRLESALESISVSINNLTSSRSTIKDADISKVSSDYIKNQILQQAASTLLATANQTPSIALQLI